MFEVIALPITLITFCLYAFQTISGDHSRLGVSLSLVLGIVLSVFFLRKIIIKNEDYKDLFSKHREHLLAAGIIVLFCLVVAGIVSPFISSQNVGGHTFLKFPGVADYYKHAYTVTAINQFGLPPSHPYFPPMKFSYYYGYYLIPAAISKSLNLDQNTVIYFYVFLTNVLSLSLLYRIATKIIKRPIFRLMALLTIIFGTSYDVILAANLKDGFMHIENWFGAKETGLIVYNTYTGLIWQPQHILAAALTIAITYKLLKERVSVWLLMLVSFYIVLSSIFIGFTMTLWLGIVFIFVKETRSTLIKAGVLSGLILLPFFVNIGGRSGIVSYYVLQAYPFTKVLAINTILTLVVEYGFSFIGLIYFVFFSKKLNGATKLALIMGVFLPIVVTWFFRSAGPNDFAMKLILPVGIAYNIIFISLLETLDNGWFKKLLIVLTCVSIISGIGGSAFEIYHRWKTRFVLSYQDSELELAVRKLSPNVRLATINKEEWAFYLPVLGYHSVLSPSLYDAGVYAGKLDSVDNYHYSSRSEAIFQSVSYGMTTKDAISKRDQLFTEINKYFSLYTFDYLVLPRKYWVKDGENFWFAYMEKLGVSNQQITDQFSLFNRNSILDKTSKAKVTVDESKPLEFFKKDKIINVPGGLWFVTACVEPKEGHARVEFDEYYSVFEFGKRDDVSCGGQVFYISADRKITISSSTNTSKIVFYPIVFR